MPYNAAMRNGNVPLWQGRRPHIKKGVGTTNFPVLWSNALKPVSGAVGATLTASTGNWVGPLLTFSKQWYRNDSVISGATNASYSVIATDSGKTVACRIIATNKYGDAYLAASLPILA
jgi:hypothetical protein